MNEASDWMAMPFMCGIVFLLLGLIMYYFPPRKINSLYGYRVFRSMKDQKNWDFAQKYSSLKIMQCSLFLFLISSAKLLLPIQETFESILGYIGLAIVIIFVIHSTEKALKNKFSNS
jgi:uncharacterized membrane protein